MSQLPEKPWTEGDTFTNDATGVEYTFDGVKWLASGGEELDLSGFDDRYLQLTGGTLKANARINVDQIEPVDPERYIRYEAGRDKRYPFALANCGMVQDIVAEAIANLPAPTFGRRFKYTTSSRPDDGHFYIASDVVFSWADLDGLVLKHTEPPDFAWNSRIKMTVWNMEGELWYAMELRGASNYSSTHLKFYKEETRFDKGLVAGEEYRVKIEGYW